MPGESVVSFSEYTDAIVRRWFLVLAATAAGAILGFVLVSTRGEEYESTARVEVGPLLSEGDSPSLDIGRQVNTTTEQSIASSQRVAEWASALVIAEAEIRSETNAGGQLGYDDPAVVERAAQIISSGLSADVQQQIRDTRDLLEVTVPNDSEILEFVATAATAQSAQQRAQSHADGYLVFREKDGLLGTERARARLVEREQQLLDELNEIAARIGAAGDNAAAVQALSYQDISKRQELAGIGTRLSNIDAISVDPGTVLDSADLPDTEAGVPPLAGLLSGALLGLVGGAGAALVVNRGDDRVRDARAELTGMGLNVFGSVPAVSRKAGRDVALFAVDDSGTEAYRRVQGGLLFELDRADKSVVLVAGTKNAGSATTVAANIAIAAARAGRRVLLVGADLRQPTLHDRLGIENTQGLSDVLLGEIALADAMVQLPELPNLKVVTAGKIVNPPTPLLQGAGLGRVVSTAKSGFDLVVFEAPPVLTVADAVDLGRFCEGALLVIEPSHVTRSEVASSVEELRRVGSDVIGTVLAEGHGG